MKIFGLLLCCTVALASDVTINFSPVIQSSSGTYQGSIINSQLGNNIFAFRGIRYGKAPTGQNRFKAPIKEEPHQGTYDATQDGAICPQTYSGDLKMSEDCLFLNVYTTTLPQNSSAITRSSQPSKPVIVFIHGGAFVSSSGSSFHLGPQVIVDANIVLVTFNYRLGVLGFLSTGDSHAPGNAGFKDQVLVLKWVQDNIAAFGGNPNKVTLMGAGIGAASVSLHLVSPMSKNLFHHAIMMSGSATFQCPIQSYEENLAKKTAQSLGCPSDTADNMINCFYTKSADEFVKVPNDPAVNNGIYEPVFSAIIELNNPENNGEAFLTQQPDEIIKQGKANFVPLALGVTKDEFGFFVIEMEEQAQKGNSSAYDQLYNNWEEQAPKHFAYSKNKNAPPNTSAELKISYLNNEPLKAGSSQKLANLYADALSIFGVHRFERLMATYSPYPVYYYKDVYERCDTNAKWSNGTRFGVVHFDSLFSSFIIGDPSKNCARDLVIDDLVRKYTFNFAENGDPAPASAGHEYPNWQPSTKDHPQHLEFNGVNSKMVQGSIYPERMSKWDELFPLSPKNN